MKNVLDDSELDKDIRVAIEYQIPRTSKRVDFIIAGADKDNKNNVIIVELKQWEKVEKIDSGEILCEYSKMVIEKVKICFPQIFLEETEEDKQEKHMNQYFSYQFKEEYSQLVGMVLEEIAARFIS